MHQLEALFAADRPVAVIYPSHSVNSYGVIRALGEQGIQVLALDVADNANFRSRYVHALTCPSPHDETAAFIDFMAELGARFRMPPVLYMLEDLYVFLAHRHRERLEPYFRFPFMADDAMLDCIDKRRTFERLADAGVPLPGTWYPVTMAELEALRPSLAYPVIVKPLVSRFDFHGGAIARVMEFPTIFENKAVQADDWETLAQLFAIVAAHGIPCCVQELIPGGPEALVGTTLYVDAGGEVHGLFTYAKLRQAPWDFGTMTLGRAIACPELAELSERIVRRLGFHGICGLEFKRDPRDGAYQFIEINPRGELWMNLAQRCGVNLPLLKYRDLKGDPCRARQTDFSRRLVDLRDDFSQYFMRYRHHRGAPYRLGLMGWLASVMRPGVDEVIFNWRDPQPGLARFKGYVARVLARRLPLPHRLSARSAGPRDMDRPAA